MVRREFEFSGGRRVKLAYRRSIGHSDRVGVVWLGGFHSDMEGEKATSLHAAAEADARSFLRFDYSGHGQSDGRFEDGTIGQWREDALGMIDDLTEGPQLLVGSSMGGWIATLAALSRPERVAGMVLLAPAPDFTELLMWARFSDSQKQQILEKGTWIRPSPYDDAGYPITRALIEDGRKWLVLGQRIEFDGPVRILQGGLDEDVPPDHSRLLASQLASADVTWTLIKDGDHRLSRPQDIERLVGETMTLARQLDSVA